MFVSVLVVPASVLIDAVYASSEIGAPRFYAAFTFIIYQKDLHDYFQLRPSCTTYSRSFSSNYTTNSLLFNFTLLSVLVLVLGIVYRANIPYLATRAFSDVNASSPQINGTRTREITKEPSQEASQEAEPPSEHL